MKINKNTTSKIIKCFTYILPFIWSGAVFLSLLETYFYPGVILKHIHVDAIIFYLVYVFSGLTALYKTEWKTNRSLKLLKKISYLAIWLFGFIYVLFYLLQRFSYQNYVFSTFHINPAQLSIPFAISIYAYLITSKRKLLLIRSNPSIVYKWFPLIVIMIWILFQNFLDIGVSVYSDISFILRNTQATYDQKMKFKVGKQFYDYVKFVEANTPENATILIPPFPTGTWPQTGNIPYMTYFLHPRKLFNGNEFSPDHDLKTPEIDYVLVVWGEMQNKVGDNTNGWPKFDIESDDIKYFNKDGSIVNKHDDYIYEEVLGQELWGVVKLEK